MSLDSLPDHITKPHLRPVQPVPVKKDGKQFVALRDPTMLVKQTMVIPAHILPILQQFQGQNNLEEIAERISSDLDQLIELSKQLDKLGLLWGPTFEKLEAQLREKLETHGSFPATASLSMGNTESDCRTAIEDYLSQTEDPELEAPAKAIIAPHLDYQRGWPNYAAAYHCLRNLQPPDRVVILGTNHFGIGDGVVLSEYGFESPMGTNPSDTIVVGALLEELGQPLTIDQLDHIAEHSIQLHLPWVQYFFDDVPIVAALIPDPLTEMIEDDEQRIETPKFVSTLKEILEGVGGETLFIASSDLSHVGPQFGEPRTVDDQRRFDVERHDREMLSKFISGDCEEFLSAMKWNRNPTRWCSIGNMAAVLMLVDEPIVELIDYRQAFDEKGLALVTSAAMALI